MIGFCLKCGKGLVEKRRGAKFCETTCRVAYNQQLKRDSIIGYRAATVDEVHLAELLVIGVKNLGLYLDMVDAKINSVALERVKCTMLEWTKSVEANPILRRIVEEQKGKKTFK